MQIKKWAISLFIALISYQRIHAEIEQIQITWNAFKCQTDCASQINANFSKIRGVQDLKINGSSGIGEMKWSPTERLSYEPFRYAAAAVGINIASIRVRVKGEINHDNENVYLVSSGDGTRFNLIGPIRIAEERYIVKYNLVSHPLSPEMRTKLIEAEKEGKTILISGPLFLPTKYPLTLVTEQIQFN